VNRQQSFRVALDASRSDNAQPTGTEHYSRQLLRALVAANHRRERPYALTLYTRRAAQVQDIPRGAAELAPIPFPRLWTHLRFAAALWRMRPDITFVPAHSLPLFFPGNGIVTVHDLGYKHFPQAHTATQRALLDISTGHSQRRAALVLADSHATADDLQRFYGTPLRKIRVVYPGVELHAPHSPDAVAAVRAKYELPARYFCFIGTLQPRKNIVRIVQAFRRWQAAQGDGETALVLAGKRGWRFDARWLQGAHNLRRLEYVPEEHKAALLAGALALVFPSLYEGFGFPAVEAMMVGTPVIASDSSSLREIVADSGLLVDPLEVEDIAAAMSRISSDSSLRAALAQRGRARAVQFRWDAAAQQVLRAFQELGAPP